MKTPFLGALALALTTTAAAAQTDIKIATIAPEGTPWVDTLKLWETNAEAASNGEIDIQIFAGGQLGNEYDVYKQVQRGRLDGASVSGAVLSDNIPETALMSTPFLFDDTATIDCIYEGAMGDQFAAIVEEKGFEHMQWGETGWVHVYAQDDLSDVSAAAGYKARVAPQPMSRLVWGAVGANQTELPYAETPAALQTGLVKAGESASVSYVAFGLGKVAPHFMKTYHMHQAGALILSAKTWKKLSPEQQQILQDSLQDTAEMRAAVRGMGDFLLGKYAEAGGPIHELSDDQRAAWKAKVEPKWPDFVSGLGGASESLWPQLIEAKNACQG